MAYYINIDEWKPEQVFEWVRGLSANIASYGKYFVEHGINGSQLLNFGPDDLQMIGIEKVGHKLEMMSAITNLRESHLSLDYETLQSLALRVSAKSRSLSAEIRQEETEEKLPTGRGKVTTSTLSGVTDLLRSVKDLLFWLDRSPFEGQEPYTSLRNTLVKISIEMATSAQRDQFAENPVAVIRSDCNQITTLCEKVVVELSDPYIAQPATLDVATVKARQDEETKLAGELADCWFMGMHIVTNHRGIHLVDGIRFQSASHQTGKIEVGDEIVQVNYQTVLSWDHKNLQTALVENPAKVILTTKKRPKHSNTFGQIYIKPYRLPSKKRDSSFRWSEHISSPSYLVIPTVHIASSSVLSPEISQSEIPSEASGGESECDDDTFAFPSSDNKSNESGAIVPATQLYIPKPRVGITRRATVAGVASSLSLQASKQVTPWTRHSNTNNLLSQTRPHSFARCAVSSNVPLLTRTESLNAISELKEFEKRNASFEENNNCEKDASNVTQETNHNLVKKENKLDTKLHPLENQFTNGHYNMKHTVSSAVSSEIEEKNLKNPISLQSVHEHSAHLTRSSTGLEIMVTPPISDPEETSTPRIPCRASIDGVTPPPRPPLSRTSSKSFVGDVLINAVAEEDPPALPPRTPHAKAPPTPLEAKPQPMTPTAETKSSASTGFYSSTDVKQHTLSVCNLEFPAVMALPPFLTQRVEPPPRTVSPLLGLRLQPPKPEEIHVALERPKPKTTESGRSIPCRSLQEIDCQGWLYRRRISRKFLGGTRWTKRWYVLRKNTVYGYKDQEDQKAESLMCLSGFNVTATIDKSKKYVFKIHHSASSFFFACENQEDLDRWLASLQSACSQISAGSSPIPKRDCYYSETDDDSITEGEREAKSPSPRKKILGITLSPSISRKSRTPPGLPPSTGAAGLNFFASKANPEKVTSASLDRKYLRFLSHEERPIPTPQYRSYRKLSADTKRELPKLSQKPTVPLKPTRMAKSESPPVRPPTIAERRMGSEPHGRVLTEPLRLNIKRSPDRSPQRSNVSSRRSSFDQSRRSSVDSRTSPLSPTHDEYIGGSPEKNWMNSLRKIKPPVPPKCQSPDGSKLKSAATYQSVKLPLTPDMHLAFEMTLGSKKSEKNKFLGLVSPKFGRKVSSVPDTPGKVQRGFFNDSKEIKNKKESENYVNLSVMSSAENQSDRRRVARNDSFLSWNKKKLVNSLPMDATYPPKEAATDDGSMLSPRSCKPTMGISMIGKQRRTPTVTTADVFVYSPPSTPGFTAMDPGAIGNTSRPPTVPSTPIPSVNQAGSDWNAKQEKCQRSSLEYPPIFEPCTYSLQRKMPPRPAPRTKFFNSEYFESKSSDA